MSPTENLAKALFATVQSGLRENAKRRYESLERDISYEVQKKNANVSYLAARGWKKERIRLAAALNSYYQVVVAPVQLVVTGAGAAGLISTNPIAHGSTRFGPVRCHEYRLVVSDFYSVASRLHVSQFMLSANAAYDLIQAITKEVKYAEEQAAGKK